jgi:hypothetical protein
VITVRRLARVLVLACAAAGCAAAAPERLDTPSGRTGSVTWEVVGIRTALQADARAINWSYTLILRNAGGSDLTFETWRPLPRAPG